MRRALRTTTFLLLFSGPVPGATADEWTFDDEYRSPLLFLHPVIDYAFNPEWTRQWETNLVAENGLRLSSGSVSTDELLTFAQLNITQHLTHGFRFLSTYDGLEGLHVDVAPRDLFFGMELKVTGPLSVQGLLQPTSAKEDMDAIVGILLTDASRRQYARLSLRFEDFVYEDKNDVGGRSLQEPIGPQWALRGRWNRWELVSEGRYLSASERVFPDPALSPEVAASSRRYGASETRLRYLAGREGFATVAFGHYEYRESREGRAASPGYSYGNEVLLGTGRYLFWVDRRWGGRGELHYLHQQAEAEGARNYSYHRRDLMPAAFLRLRLGASSMLELGYMGTFYDWTMDSRDPGDGYDGEGYADKVKLAWTHRFLATARLRISLSHEPNLARFGGGNVQYQMLF
jgi:hypothetical protein